MPTPSPSSRQPLPLSTRKIDIFHILFLSFIVFLALSTTFPHPHPHPHPPPQTNPSPAIDLVPLYPIALWPYTSIFYEYFRTTFNDPLYFKDPPFFRLYTILEAVYTVPISLWSIRGLIQDDKNTPLNLLVLATHLLSSTAVCFVEVLGAQDWPGEVVNKNLPGYVGFGTVGMFPVSQALTKRKAR